MRFNKNHILYAVLILLILAPYIGLFGVKKWYNKKVEQIDNSCFILISKEDMNLRLIDYHGREVMSFPMACGKKYGNKEKKGDMKTPEGVFHVSDIQKSSSWKHDFGDGLGNIKGAYGPYFIRLDTPGHKGIGIHGTHKPESIGTRDTEGCIRLNNEDLEKLVKHVNIGMVVVITTSYSDAINSVDTLKINPVA